jgi:hypothetical protein
MTFDLADDHEHTLLADPILAGERRWTFACQVTLVNFFVALSFGRREFGD